MNRSFQARFKLTFDDFQVLSAASRRLTRGRRFAQLIFTAACVILIAAALYSASVRDWGFTAYFAVLAAFLIALRFVYTPW